MQRYNEYRSLKMQTNIINLTSMLDYYNRYRCILLDIHMFLWVYASLLYSYNNVYNI